MSKAVQVFVAVAVLTVAGCMLLSPDEQRLLGQLEEHELGCHYRRRDK